MRKRLLLRPALWALVILAATTAWHLRPLDRTTLYPVPFPNGKYGYVNSDGRFVIGAEWDAACSYGADGFALVTKVRGDEIKAGFIDRFGHVAEPLGKHFAGDVRFELQLRDRVIWRKIVGNVTNTGQVVVADDEKLTPLRQGKEKKWGLARNGKTIVESKWDGIEPFGQFDLAPVRIGEKCGFINRAGMIMIEPKWDYVGAFASNGLAVVLKGELSNYNPRQPGFMTINSEPSTIPSGFIDREGKLVIPLEWDGAWSFDNVGLAIVQKHDKFGAIDSKGKLVVPTEWHKFNTFDPGGLACVKKDRVFGYIDRTGTVVVPLIWDSISSFDDFESIQADDDDVVDQFGNKEYRTKGSTLIRKVHKGLASVERNGKHGFVDRAGNVVIALEWDHLRLFDDRGFALATRNGKQGFIDRAGTFAIPLDWDDLTPFDSQSMAFAKKNGECGFIDRSGRIAVPLEWDSADVFDAEDLSIVTKAKKWGAIDRTGKIVIPIEWDHISEFQNGVARVQKAKQIGFINRKGETLVSPMWDYANPHKIRFFDEEDKLGLADFAARIDPYTPDLIQVTRYNKSGIIDWSGNVIIAPGWTHIDIRSDAEAKTAAFVVSRSIDNAQAGWLKDAREWLFKLLGREEARSQLCHLYDTQGRLIWSSDWLSEAFWMWAVALAAGIVVLADGVAMWRRRKRQVAGTS